MSSLSWQRSLTGSLPHLWQNVLFQPPQIDDCLRCGHTPERRPEQRKRQAGLLVPLEVVRELLGRARHRWSQFPPGSLISLLASDVEEKHARDFEIVDRARAACHFELIFDRRPPSPDVFGGVLYSDPAGQSVFGDPLRRDLRYPEAPEKDRWMRLLNGLYAEAAFWKRGELAVILEELLGPDTLHDLDRLNDVFVPSFIDVRRTRGLELLRHPARSDANVDPSAGKVVPGRYLRRQDSG